MRLTFEWDANKARNNFKKHKVRFTEAKSTFNDPMLLTFRDDEHSISEDRFISVGLSASRRLLLVVHTEQESRQNEIIIRIISCRKATAAERRRYEEGKI